MIEGRFKVVAIPESREIGAFTDEGAEGLSLTLRIVDPPDAPECGAEVTWIGWLTDKALERTAKTLRVLGWTGGKSGANIGDTTGLGTVSAHVVLSVRTYDKKDGTKGEEQDVYIPLPEDSKKSFKKKRTDAQIDAFSRSLEGRLAKMLDPTQPKAATASRATAPTNGRGAPTPPPRDFAPDDDDIPF